MNQYSSVMRLLYLGLLSVAVQGTVRAAAPAITIDYPRGGEVWVVGTTQRVVLGSKTKPKSVKVQLSRDGGVNFELLGTIQISRKEIPALSFTVTAPASASCVIRASDSSRPSIFAMSSSFGIVASLQGPIEIADGAVTTPKLADLSVTNSKVAARAVTSDKIGSGPSSANFVLTADGAGSADWQPVGAAGSVQNFTGALMGDVTGTQSATIVSKIGGLSSADVVLGVNLATAAADSNLPNAIIRRDVNGNFSAGTISADLIGNIFGNLTGDASGTASGFTGTLSGDVTGTQNATIVSQVGGASASAISSGALLANAASDQNSSDTIVRRDGGGNFSAGTITANLIGDVVGNVTGDISGNALNVTGVIAVDHGGTGQISYTNGQLLIGNSTGSTLTKGTLTGTPNRISVVNGAGSITLSAPQDIAVTSSPTFISVTATSSLISPVLNSTASQLDLQIGGARALRITTGATPNLIGGHNANTVSAGVIGAVIAGGGVSSLRNNRVTGSFGTISGGSSNTAGSDAFVGGGESNDASGGGATIAGGTFNSARFASATVAGGFSNVANAPEATVGGGSGNTAGMISTIGGGLNNKAGGPTTQSDTVGGGVGNWALGNGSTVAGGLGNHASGLSSTIAGGGGNRAEESSSTIAGGDNNTADGVLSTIGGGTNNHASGYGSTIAGGQGNSINWQFATVGGGFANHISGEYATIPGGLSNFVGGDHGVAIGSYNTVSSFHDGAILISTGTLNSVAANEFAVRGTGGMRFVTAVDSSQNPTKTFRISPSGSATVQGDLTVEGKVFGNFAAVGITGVLDIAHGGTGSSTQNFVDLTTDQTVGGNKTFTQNLTASTSVTTPLIVSETEQLKLIATGIYGYRVLAGARRVVAGGDSQTVVAEAQYAVIAGGNSNAITDSYGVIAGGASNLAGDDAGTVNDARFATIGGGESNRATAPYSTIPGGFSNEAQGQYSIIGGGEDNVAAGDHSVIGGGVANETSEYYSTVAGGAGNSATGLASTAIGGFQNSAGGHHSLAGGTSAIVLPEHSGSIVFSDLGVNFDRFFSAASNEFAVRARGGVRFITAASGETIVAGVKLDPGATAWTTISDKNQKKNFKSLNGEKVLSKLASMNVDSWNYKWEDESSTQHIGPVAQDFKAAFYPGRDDKGITTLEFDGVEMAALKALEKRTAELRSENDALRARLSALESVLVKSK